MILRWLKLENIRSYIHEEIIFPEGSVLLSGDIGSGKTTILQSIEFALFGFNKNDLTGDSLLRHGKHEASIELCFEINKNIIIVKRFLRRTNSVKQEHGYLIINNQKIDCTAVELRTRILELLGYPLSMVSKTRDVLYRYTVYTPQDEMKQILRDDKEQRLETIRKIFNIDKYKRVRENTQLLAKELRIKKLLYEQQISDVMQKQNNLDDFLIKKTEMDKLYIDSKKKQQELFLNLKISQDEYKEIEKKVFEQKSLQQEIVYLDQQLLAIAMQEKKSLGYINQLEQQLQIEKDKITSFVISNVLKINEANETNEINEQKLTIELELFQKELEQLNEQLLSLNQQRLFGEKNILQLEKEKAILKQDLVKKEEKQKEKQFIGQALQSKETIDNEISAREKLLQITFQQITAAETLLAVFSETKQKMTSLNTALNKCPMCMQNVPEEHKHNVIFDADKNLNNHQEKLNNLRLKKQINEESLNKLKKQFSDLLLQEKRHIVLHEELRQLDEKTSFLTEKEKQLQQLQQNQLQLQEKCTLLDEHGINSRNKLKLSQLIVTLKRSLDDLRKYNILIKEKESLQKLALEKETVILQRNQELALLLITKKEIMQKIDEKNKLLNYFADLQLIFEQKRLQVIHQTELERDIVILIAKLTTEINTIDKIINQLNKELEEKMIIKEKLSKVTELTNWLQDKFIPFAGFIEKQILLSIYREFNEFFISWFAILVDDETLSVRLDEEFTPFIQQNGYDTSFENLSGGEKTAVALAYRLALNKVINDYIGTIATKDLIILDEPTEGFSYDQLDKIKDVLDQINIKQVIIVSHEAKVESFVQNIIRLNKSLHISNVVS